MEEKNLIKEMLYLGAGLTVRGLHKMKAMVEHFSDDNEDARKQGEVVVNDFINKTKETTEDFRKKVDNMAHQLSEKGAMKKEELTAFLQDLMEKPGELQDEVKHKFQDISNNLSHNANLKKQEAQLWLEELKAEIQENRDLAKSKVDELIQNFSLESKSMNEKGKSLITDITEKSSEIKKELDEGLHRALDRFLSKINLTTTGRLEELEKRVNSLESKNSKKS